MSASNNEIQALESFKELYKRLDKHSMKQGLLEEVYSDNMVFEDSFHKIEGIENFKSYCRNMYENVEEINFEFHEQFVGHQQAMLVWTMRFRHRYLKRARLITVEGSSLIRVDKKIFYHRDYFDGGELLYEQLPFFGSAIRALKRRMA